MKTQLQKTKTFNWFQMSIWQIIILYCLLIIKEIEKAWSQPKTYRSIGSPAPLLIIQIRKTSNLAYKAITSNSKRDMTKAEWVKVESVRGIRTPIPSILVNSMLYRKRRANRLNWIWGKIRKVKISAALCNHRFRPCCFHSRLLVMAKTHQYLRRRWRWWLRIKQRR